MESAGAFPCTEYDSFMVPQFLDLSLFSSGHDKRIPISLSTAACVDESLFHYLDDPVNNGYSCNPSDFVSIPSTPTYFLGGLNQIPVYNHAFMSNEKSTNDPYGTIFPDISMEGTPFVNGNMNNALVVAKEMLIKRKFDSAGLQNIADPSEYVKKRLRITRDGGSDGISSCSYSSDDENVALVSKSYQAGNSNGKARATRGGATDPQSIYARKRRERINERLKILQNLVPNGTKVDISTMLEEAVHYVKFLQLQIKLLSSDELWMYAPLAYNGVDMGLYQKIFSQLLQQ